MESPQTLALNTALKQGRERGRLTEAEGYASPRLAISNAIGKRFADGFGGGDSETFVRSAGAYKRWLELYIPNLFHIYQSKLENFGQLEIPESVETARLHFIESFQQQVQRWKQDFSQNKLFGIDWLNDAAESALNRSDEFARSFYEPLWLDALHHAQARKTSTHISEPFKPDPVSSIQEKKKVAIIYGRDTSAFNCMVKAIKLCGLEPYPFSAAKKDHLKLHEGTFEIVSKMLASTVASVVIFTPDEEAQLRGHLRGHTDEGKLRHQPRQNVILEYGMALALHQDNILLMAFGDVDVPSDMAFVHRNRWSDGAGAISFMHEKFKNCGLPVGKKPTKKAMNAVVYEDVSQKVLTSDVSESYLKLKDYVQSWDRGASGHINKVWEKVRKELVESFEPDTIKKAKAASIAMHGYWNLIKERGEVILDAAEKLGIPMTYHDEELNRLLRGHRYQDYLKWFENPWLAEKLHFNSHIQRNVEVETNNNAQVYWQTEIERRRREGLLRS